MCLTSARGSSSSSSSSLPATPKLLLADLKTTTTSAEGVVVSARRKRVRFNPEYDKVVEWLPLCSEFSESERSNRWLRASEKEEARLSTLQDTRDCALADQILPSRKKQKRSHPSFSETYQAIYQVCHNLKQNGKKKKEEEEAGDESTCSQELLEVAPHVITLLAAANPAARGLEDRIVPRLGLARRIIRRRTIRSVIQLHQQEVVKQREEEGKGTTTSALSSRLTNRVALLSQSMTHPSRQFAQASGFADATVAMAEYSKDLLVKKHSRIT